MQAQPVQGGAAAEPRVQVIEEPTAKLGGPTYKQVTPKTYQVLKDELPGAGGKCLRTYSKVMFSSLVVGT